MRTLLLVKYRDEPFAKMCTRYPFAATVEKNNLREVREHMLQTQVVIYTISARKSSYEIKSEHFPRLLRATV